MKGLSKHIIKILQLPITLLFVSGLAVFSSCINEEVCEDVSSLPVRIGFYMTDTLNEENPVAINNLTIYGMGNDSLLYNNNDEVASIELPLNATEDSCAFIFQYSNAQDSIIVPNDTIWFDYQRKPNLISMDCGFVTFYEINEIDYTRNVIDSVNVDDPNISNSLDEHIKIFLLDPDSIP